MVVVVTGGRDYDDYDWVVECIADFPVGTTFIAGGARGLDKLVYRAGWSNGKYKVIEVKAEWDKYGKSAGYKRNVAMADIYEPELCLAFPGGKGTQHMVDICKARGIPVVFCYRGGEDGQHPARDE